MQSDLSMGQILGIKDIQAIDLDSIEMLREWDLMLQHSKQENLKEILAIRSLISFKIQEILIRKSYVHPPVYMFSSCVDPLNHHTEAARFNYYGQELSVVQSLIFHKMAVIALTECDSVFWVSPNLRKEKFVKDKKRYATEFTQIDFESSLLTMETAMQLIEEIVQEVYSFLIKEKAEEIKRISGRTLKAIRGKLKRFDAVDEAAKRFVPVNDIEEILAMENEEPFFITNLKREAYDRRDDITGKYINYDLVLPIFGEVLSGAEREFSYERLLLRMEELDYPIDYFAPILKLAKEHGLKSTAGAGFGLERFVRGILLLEDIADIYPFARVPEGKVIF